MAIDEVGQEEWEEKKDKLTEEKIPFAIIKGKTSQRAILASRIQDLMGEYYIWKVPKRPKDIETAKKMNYIGGDGVIIGDTNVWTNSEEVKRSIHEEVQRRTIKGKIAGNEDGVPWGRIVGEAMIRQVEDRELGEVNFIEKEAQYQPRTMLIEKGEKEGITQMTIGPILMR